MTFGYAAGKLTERFASLPAEATMATPFEAA